MRQTVLFDAGPIRSSVTRNVYSAAGPSAELGPGVQFKLPHSGKEHPGIVRIHGKTGTSNVFPRKKDAFPVKPSVHRAVNAAFLLRTGRATNSAGKDNVGIRRVNDYPANAACFLQPHIGPGLACVRGFVNSIPDYIAIANNPCLTGSGPHDTRVGRSYGKCANSCHRLLIENGCPTIAAVCRFPYASRCGARVVRAGISGNTCDRCDPVPNFRTDKPEPKLAALRGFWLLRLCH